MTNPESASARELAVDPSRSTPEPELAVSSSPPTTQDREAMTETPCVNCGYSKTEHTLVNGWCFHGGSGEDATQYEPSKSWPVPVPFAPSSPTSEPLNEVNLAQRFALKEAIVRLRQELEATTRSADYPYARVDISDVAMALDEIDRLMRVNGQIAKMWCDAEDRLPIPPTSEPIRFDDATERFLDDYRTYCEQRGYMAPFEAVRQRIRTLQDEAYAQGHSRAYKAPAALGIPPHQKPSAPLPPTSEPIHDENCDALRSGSDMLEGILRACNCRPIPATSEPIPASDLRDALDDYQRRSIEWDDMDPECDPSYEEHARDNFVAARAAVESLFSAQLGEIERLRARRKHLHPEMFPIQGAPPIPWSVAEKAYAKYGDRHGQSLERLAERGGFGVKEMDEYYPAWRSESDELLKLRAELASLRVENSELKRLAEIDGDAGAYMLAELASLRSSSLTESERLEILENLDHGKHCTPPSECVCKYFIIVAKLSALRSSTPDKGIEK